MTVDLTKARSQFRAQGHYVIPEFINADEIAAIKSAMLQFCKLYPEFCVPEESEDGQAKKLLFQALNFAEKIGFFKSFLKEARFETVLETFMDEPATLFIEDFHFKEPGGGSYIPHQDLQSPVLEWVNAEYKPQQPIDKLVTVCIAIEDQDRLNGCMKVAPRQHQNGLLGPMGGNLEPGLYQNMDFEYLELNADDALFFDGYCPHGSEVNRSHRSRKSLFLFYGPQRCGDQREWAQDYFLHDKKDLKAL